MRAWAAAIRIARREARKSKGRSALVLAMIALPVAFLSFSAVTFDMFQLSEEEVLDRRLGKADAALTWVSHASIKPALQVEDRAPVAGKPGEVGVGWPTTAEVLAELPAGSRVIPMAQSSLRARGSESIVYLSMHILDLRDPMTRGIGELKAGRAVAGDDEIMINAAAARQLDLHVGSTLHATGPDHDYLVVGIVEFPDNLGPMAVANGAAFLAAADRPFQWLADTPAPLTWDQMERLNNRGISVVGRGFSDDTSRTRFATTTAEDLAIGFLASGLVTLEVVLLAGPAFAVGARRRARDLALIAAAGGAPKHLRRVVLAEGAVLGAGGAAIGILLGVSLAVLGRPIVEESLFQTRAGGWRFFPAALIAIAVLAIGTGLLAATVPAFIAARQDVVTVLNGRRGVLRSRRRWIIVGLTMVGAGVVIAMSGAMLTSESLMLLGIVLAELGLVVLTPSLVGLIAKVGRWLPLSPRLALRDTARNRTAAAPAISAIMAAVAGAVAIGVFFTGLDHQRTAGYEPYLPPGSFTIRDDGFPVDPPRDWARVEAAVQEVLPSVRLRTFAVPVCPDQVVKGFCDIAVVIPEQGQCPYAIEKGDLTPSEIQAARQDGRCGDLRTFSYANAGWVSGSIVDSGEVLAMLTDASDSELAAARQTLASGGAVVTDSRMIYNGEVTLAKMTGEDPSLVGKSMIKVPGYLIPTNAMATSIVVSAATAAQLGMPVELRGIAGANDTILTAEEESRLQDTLTEVGLGLYASIERGPSPFRDPTALILALAAAAIALGAAGIATGLATVDGRADLSTLAAVGAGPNMRRRLSLSRAGIIAGLGALLGTAAGLGGAWILITALNRVYALQWPYREEVPFAVPWQSLAVIVAVPIVAMAGAALFTRTKLPIERRF